MNLNIFWNSYHINSEKVFIWNSFYCFSVEEASGGLMNYLLTI